MRLYLIPIAILILALSACDESNQSTPAFFQVVGFEPGTDADGYAYLDITIENGGNGTGKNVQCVITIEAPGGEVLSTKTALFERGTVIFPEDQSTKRVVLLYHISALEQFAADPVLEYDFDLSWDEVGL